MIQRLKINGREFGKQIEMVNFGGILENQNIDEEVISEDVIYVLLGGYQKLF